MPRVSPEHLLRRLAFAVAAHLEPDILLLDEVLAVGDAGFRAKCIRHMKETLSSNVAVLFVSHQRSQIAEVCHRCVVLQQGRLVYSGDPESAWERYVECLQQRESLESPDVRLSGGRLIGLEIADADGCESSTVAAHEPLSLTVAYELTREFADLAVGINFHQGNGHLLTDCTTFDAGMTVPSHTGKHAVRLDLDGLPLAGGSYLIGVRLYDLTSGEALDRHYQRYPLVIGGPADHHVIYLRQAWSLVQRIGDLS